MTCYTCSLIAIAAGTGSAADLRIDSEPLLSLTEGILRQEMVAKPRLRQEQDRGGILVVDDESVIRDLCAKVLKGYRIYHAGDGEEALQVIGREKVDVVLTDVMMPRMNGIDLLQTIKAQQPNMGVIIMTGYGDRETILRALKADADDFISKPINLLQLQTTIEKVLEKQALKAELLQLKRMDRLKTDFLGLVSHKLKTPITAISLFIQNLARGIGDPDDPGFRQTLDLILEESSYLGYLIKDLLFYSDVVLQESPQRLEPVNPRDLALESLGNLESFFSNKGVGHSYDFPTALPDLSLDRRQIGFVFYALLENALKFTPRGGLVTLRGSVEEDTVRLTVEDNGQGIPAEELPKVFEKFYQVDPDNTGQVRGFGLGLFYARQFAQNHGASIHLESSPGVGTKASLILPRNPR
jgi:signal transduction histidine kinase